MREEKTMRVFLVLTAVLGGCIATVPGDGRLVLVVLDGDAATASLREWTSPTEYEDRPFSYYVGRGVRYWDAVGARLRLPEQLQGAEAVEAESAPEVHVLLNHSVGGHVVGLEHAATADFQVFADEVFRLDANGPDSWETIVAHEVGHSLGLRHLPDGESGVMAAASYDYPGLQPGDVAEFCRRWPTGPGC